MIVNSDYFLVYFSVFRSVLARILDIPAFDPEINTPPNVTLHQLFTFFEHGELPDIDQYLLDVAGESKILLFFFTVFM